MSGAGIDAEGRWTPQFPGQRRPFAPGNTVALKHGVYAVVHLSDAARAITDDLRPLVPSYTAGDEPLLQLLGQTIARVNAGSKALAEVDAMAGEGNELSPYMTAEGDKIQRLREDLRRWVALSAKLMQELGLTPKSRIAMTADVVRVEAGITALREEGRLIRIGREQSA